MGLADLNPSSQPIAAGCTCAAYWIDGRLVHDQTRCPIHQPLAESNPSFHPEEIQADYVCETCGALTDQVRCNEFQITGECRYDRARAVPERSEGKDR